MSDTLWLLVLIVLMALAIPVSCWFGIRIGMEWRHADRHPHPAT